MVMLKKIVSATKKSTMRSIRRDVTARASVALTQESSKKEREIVRILSMSTAETDSLPSTLLERDNEEETETSDSIGLEEG